MLLNYCISIGKIDQEKESALFFQCYVYCDSCASDQRNSLGDPGDHGVQRGYWTVNGENGQNIIAIRRIVTAAGKDKRFMVEVIEGNR